MNSKLIAVAHSAIDEAIGEQPADSVRLVAAKCRALIVGYTERWSDNPYTPLEIEQTTTAPLTNPTTNRDSRTFSLAGKIDVVGEYSGRRVLIDHKTTSLDIATPDSPFWRQLVVEGQVSHYMLLKWLNGEKIDYAVWDVMRKPQTSPKKLSKADMKAVASLGEYCDRKVSVGNPTQWDGRETLDMYEARLTRDCTKERPEHYFQRRTIPRLDKQLIDYAHDVWQHGKDLLHSRNTTERTNRPPPMNSGACMLYGSPCKFLGICSGCDTPDSDRWQRKGWIHNELEPTDGDGKDLLTNSRIRCFQTCRRKHHYEYELGIERIDEEEREALFFGTLWHRALEAWWSCFLPYEESSNGDESNGCPDNEAGNPDRTSQAAIAR